MFKKFINSLSQNNNKILLGRWNRSGNDIKNIYANHDNCGDIICKDPKLVKNLINRELTIKNKNKNKNN